MDSSGRPILRGESQVWLREATAKGSTTRSRRTPREATAPDGAPPTVSVPPVEPEPRP